MACVVGFVEAESVGGVTACHDLGGQALDGANLAGSGAVCAGELEARACDAGVLAEGEVVNVDVLVCGGVLGHVGAAVGWVGAVGGLGGGSRKGGGSEESGGGDELHFDGCAVRLGKKTGRWYGNWLVVKAVVEVAVS